MRAVQLLQVPSLQPICCMHGAGTARIREQPCMLYQLRRYTRVLVVTMNATDQGSSLVGTHKISSIKMYSGFYFLLKILRIPKFQMGPWSQEESCLLVLWLNGVKIIAYIDTKTHYKLCKCNWKMTYWISEEKKKRKKDDLLRVVRFKVTLGSLESVQASIIHRTNQLRAHLKLWVSFHFCGKCIVFCEFHVFQIHPNNITIWFFTIHKRSPTAHTWLKVIWRRRNR